MKKDLEKQIEEAANKLQKEINTFYVKDSFIIGAKSEAAKEYWLNTLIEEVIENETFFDFASKCALKKYELGTREHTIATMSIKFGMGCSLTKQYWQQDLYTEEEVKRLCSKAWLISPTDLNDLIYRFDKWFEQNKKK